LMIGRNNLFLALLSMLVLFNSSCRQIQTEKRDTMTERHLFTNDLIHESSPYLLQHAHNPVDWYPWGEKALQKARDENKMMIISIGYAACHWCHVMEHESFEDTVVAKLMNENFICIKVDREERPDVDQVYMTAAQLISGSGGWPLNALALPDGRPFFAGTYFPKERWMKLLQYFIEINNTRREELLKQATEITKGIHVVEHIPFKKDDQDFSMHGLDAQFNNMKPGIDFVKGGPNRAPKFPMPANWDYLMHYYYVSGNKDAWNAVTITLDQMALGGINDQLGGGFARYSTDKNWLVPHFEKMLYDNAQLMGLYSHGYQLTKNPLYKNVVYETHEFIKRELTSPEGGFYSSLDADSEGEEGKFYVFTKDEIEKALGTEAPLFINYYNINNSGNWEHGKNILHRNESDDLFAKKNNIPVETLPKKINSAKEKLMKVRNKRVRPGLDDKILTSWNALMLKGYVQAYRAFGDDDFLKAAISNAKFLMKNLIHDNGEIFRNYKNKMSSINGLLDDYAFIISTFIELYQATFDEKWLLEADKIMGYVLEHFYDPASGMFFYTHNKYSDLIARKMELSDNVIPSSNSEMARNLFALGQFFYKDDYISKARQMLVNVKDDVEKNIAFYSNWGMLEIDFVAPPYEIAIVGKNFEALRKEMDKYFLPGVLLSGGNSEGRLPLLENKQAEGKTLIYVCRDKTCKLPVTDVSKAMEQIKENRIKNK
ncbi:MAG: thioredoxin domain-containing protein, partial [Chitinophagaceae bacterium]